jgi:hypothetical protein
MTEMGTAKSAGILVGDRIIYVNGTKSSNIWEFKYRLLGVSSSPIELDLERNGKSMILTFNRNPSRDTLETNQLLEIQQLAEREQLRDRGKMEAHELLQKAANFGLKTRKANDERLITEAEIKKKETERTIKMFKDKNDAWMKSNALRSIKKAGGNRKRISKKGIINRKRISKKMSKSIISGGMKLNVKSWLQNLNVTLDVAPTDTIYSIKSKLIDKIGVDPRKFYKLTFNDNELSDDETISSYGIPENSDLMFRRHTPGFKLNEEERRKKSDKHQYGLCCCCDKGLEDQSDFQFVKTDDDRFIMMCNACHHFNYALDFDNVDAQDVIHFNTRKLLGDNKRNELKKTAIAEQRVCGTGVMWWPLNDQDNVCEECGCLINDERELDLSLCKKCAEESGDWNVDS